MKNIKEDKKTNQEEKFKGKEDEDFDLQWEDLRAFFALYTYNEEDKVRLEVRVLLDLPIIYQNLHPLYL